MRVWYVSALATILLCVLTPRVYANHLSATLFKLVIQSGMYPEDFDSYVDRNESLFNEDLIACVNRLVATSVPLAEDHNKTCNSYSDPYMRDACLGRNNYALVVLWGKSIQARLKGTPWCRTPSGDMACTGKALGGDLYVEIFRLSLPNLRQVYRCDYR